MDKKFIDNPVEAYEELKAENIKFTLDTKKLVAQYSAKLEQLKQTLQEIKAIAEHEIKELTDSAINGGRYLEIIDLITKAEEE